MLAFKHAGIDEIGIVVNGPEMLIGKTIVAFSEDFYRPTDVVNLWGDPIQTSFEQLVKSMVKDTWPK